MIDIHLRILSGVDDGPETIEEAVALARVLVQEGIHTSLATLHFNDLFPRRSAAEMKERGNSSAGGAGGHSPLAGAWGVPTFSLVLSCAAAGGMKRVPE